MQDELFLFLVGGVKQVLQICALVCEGGGIIPVLAMERGGCWLHLGLKMHGRELRVGIRKVLEGILDRCQNASHLRFLLGRLLNPYANWWGCIDSSRLNDHLTLSFLNGAGRCRLIYGRPTHYRPGSPATDGALPLKGCRVL